MTVYTNIDGTWTTVARPYVYRQGISAPVKQVWVKRSGVWTIAFDYDVTPPAPPELTLSVIDGRYIMVGVRGTGSTHDPEMAMIRTMVGGTAGYPTSQFGSGYIGGADVTYPTEPWSEVRYNGYGGGTHNTTSLIKKEYPLNVGSKYDLPGGKHYYFQSWAMDLHGNWSMGTAAQIYMPKTGDSNVVVKHGRFNPIADGNLRAGVVYEEPLTVQNGQDVAFFYGGAMAQSMRQNQPVVDITSAQILLYRKNDDGPAVSNVYLFWHNEDWMTWAGGDIHQITYVGQIAKGQAKWFAIPDNIKSHLADESARGIGLYYKDPNKPQANPEDYLQLYSFDDETGGTVTGMIDLVWTEKPS